MNLTPLYIAQRYLLAKKGSTAVTFITRLAVIAMMIAVAAMFIIISVFSGLEDLNRAMISNLHADLTVSASSGKILPDVRKVTQTISAEPGVDVFSKIIEEKVYTEFNGKGDIAYLRGVDSAYVFVNPLTDDIINGQYPSFDYSNEAVIENQLAVRLGIPVGSSRDFMILYMPKPGKGIISREEDIFNKKEVYTTGSFLSKDQLNNFIIAPIELSQQLLGLPKQTAYQIVIKLDDTSSANAVRESLQKKLGKNFQIKTKQEENAAFWKMINTEKIFIYMIFALVILITTFNLAGAIIILQLDKKLQAKALRSLGFSAADLRRTYFFTGILIVAAGIVLGLLLGTILCIFQQQTGTFRAGATLPFPVTILPENYFFVFATAAVFSFIIIWIFSRSGTSKNYNQTN